MSPRTGRPTNNPRNINLNIRISKEEANLIQECADRMNTARVNVIIEGVKKVKADLDNKWKTRNFSPAKDWNFLSLAPQKEV